MALTKIGIDAISGAIGTTQLEDGSVTSAKIATGGIATVDMADGSVTSLKIADGGIATADIADGAITAAKLDSAAVYDRATSSTGYFDIPSGTTAQRPGSPASGMIRYNTDNGSLEFYNGDSWISTNLIPYVNSVTGIIYAGGASTLSLSIASATETVTVRFTEGGTVLKDVTGITVVAGSASVTVPSEVYGQSAGDTIAISVLNQDGTPSSNAVNETVIGLPTGGTITTVSSYRYHTFTSSGNFVVPTGFTATADYLLVAGGAGGGYDYGGGGGAGGAIDSTVSLSAQTYAISIGGGGAGGILSTGKGYSGTNSTAFGQTALGGGGGMGGAGTPQAAASGGSGGGGGWGTPTGASGTAGQGNKGGDGDTGGGSDKATGGGGGAGAVGQNGVRSSKSGNGGAGINWKSLGTYYAGGGGGGGYAGYSVAVGTGGTGGGGNGASQYVAGSAGTANTGGGGGGDGGGPGPGATAGGSGVCIVRYTLL